MPNIDLNPIDWAEVERILEQHVPECEVWAFGSRVKWTAKPHSDLDLVVITEAPLSLDRMSALKEAFDESFLPIHVDVVDWTAAKESFRSIIENNKVVIKAGGSQRGQLSGWRVMALEDCLESIIDYRGKTPDKTSYGIPLVTAKVIKNGRIETPTEFISAAEYDSWMRRGIPRAGDVVLTTEAPLGEVAQIGEGRVALAQRVITLRGKSNVLDNAYLLYLLQTADMQDQLKARATGTTVLGIRQSELRKAKVRLPPIGMQKSAAAILKTIDDRISLLRETNATLEAVAQALFKSWFVDFDPVRAKAGGRDPEGLDPATAALFPDRFEDSELGPIPMGWQVGVLANLADLNPESWTNKNHPDNVAYIDLANAKDNVIAEVTEYTFDEAPSRARRVLRRGDTIVGTVRPGNRSYAFISDAVENLTGSTGFAVLRPNEDVNAEFVFLSATSDTNIEFLTHFADGGAYPAVRPEAVSGLRSVLPVPDVLRAFHDATAPIVMKIGANHQQAKTLASLRDTLLPRLIAGTLRLPEAEAMLKEAD